MEKEKNDASSRRRRANRACAFCKRRKIKCTQEVPSCMNCVAYKEKCFYTDGPKKARPSNSRIMGLEEQIRQLEKQLDAERSKKKPTDNLGTGAVAETVSSSESSDEEENDGELVGGNIRAGSQEYHGPSSVFFDEVPSEEKQFAPQGSAVSGNGSNLNQEAATQRELENLNLASDQMDRDGVEAAVASRLLSIYWSRVNSVFMIVYRPAFNKSWTNGGPYFSKLLLNAMYFSASRYVVDNGGLSGAKLAEKFRHRFKQLLGAAFDKSKITTMQALLIVSASLSAVGKDRSTAWLYSGLANRMMVDLGLHTIRPAESTKQSDENVEVSRRLFWSAFVIDKLQAFYHGRPASIQEADSMVPLSFNDQFEELESWCPMAPAPLNPGVFGPTRCVSTFFHTCRLALLMNKLLNKIYREKTEVQDPESIRRNLNTLNAELDEWSAKLPQHLRLCPTTIGTDTSSLPSPHTYLLLIQYNVLRILLNRPFVTYGHLQSVLNDVAIQSFSKCAHAAHDIAVYLDSYNRVHSFQLAPYFLFYASFVASTIHVRVAAQTQLKTDAFACLRICLMVYESNIQHNPAVKKAQAAIQRLMDKIGLGQGPSNTTHNVSGKSPASSPQIHSRLSPSSSAKAPGGSSPSLRPPPPISLQSWDMADLDFNAILQSFGMPRASGENTYPNNTTLHPSAALMQNPNLIQNPNLYWPTQPIDDNTSKTDQYFYPQALEAGNDMQDVLYGFNIPSPEGGWLTTPP